MARLDADPQLPDDLAGAIRRCFDALAMNERFRLLPALLLAERQVTPERRSGNDYIARLSVPDVLTLAEQMERRSSNRLLRENPEANLAVVAALFGPEDRVLLDASAHRSLKDACVLARVQVTTFPHNNVAAVERELRRAPAGQRTLIVVDGLYSMDGDLCPLPELVDLKRRYGAFLLVDEAHALGVIGPTGRGVHEHFGMAADAVDVWTGSLSKAVPSNGGFLAGRRDLILYLQHAAAPFWFSAALAPAAAGAALEALRVARREPERLVALRRNADALRTWLRARGYDTGNSESAIVPVLVGDDVAAWRLARRLFDEGVLVSAVVHPAVPQGAARLRLCATAAQSAADLDEALDAFDRAGRPAGLA